MRMSLIYINLYSSTCDNKTKDRKYNNTNRAIKDKTERKHTMLCTRFNLVQLMYKCQELKHSIYR